MASSYQRISSESDVAANKLVTRNSKMLGIPDYRLVHCSSFYLEYPKSSTTDPASGPGWATDPENVRIFCRLLWQLEHASHSFLQDLSGRSLVLVSAR